MAELPNLPIVTLRKAGGPIVAVTPVCEEDACWLPQFMREAESINVEVAWFLDNVSDSTERTIRDWSRTIGFALLKDNGVKFSEVFRTFPTNIAVESGASHFMPWDIDETYGPEVKDLLRHIVEWEPKPPNKIWTFHKYEVWQDSYPFPLIRCDEPFSPFYGYRHKLYPCRPPGGGEWRYAFHTNGPIRYLPNGERTELQYEKTDGRVIHWGFSTPELRGMHCDRWNRLYEQNPYGTWQAAIDEDRKPWLLPLFPWMSHFEFTAVIGLCQMSVSEDVRKTYRPSQELSDWWSHRVGQKPKS